MCIRRVSRWKRDEAVGATALEIVSRIRHARADAVLTRKSLLSFDQGRARPVNVVVLYEPWAVAQGQAD